MSSSITFKKSLVVSCILSMLYLSLISSTLFIPQVAEAQITPEYIIEGDVVYIDNEQARIEVYPHTLEQSGYAYLNITSKQYSGEIDFVFGFNTSMVKPKKLDIYQPYNVTNNRNITKFFNSSDYEVEYNFTAYQSPIAYTGFVWIYEIFHLNGSSSNRTLIHEYYFDWANFQTKILYWNELILWKTITDKIDLDIIKYQFRGVDTWYKGKANITAGVEYHSRYYLEIAPDLGEHYGKYWVAFKPHTKSLQKAIEQDVFYYLDPWWNSSFMYRKSHNITGTTATGTSDIFTDGFEDGIEFDKWDDNGATAWEISTSEVHTGVNSSHSGSTTDGNLTSDDMNLSSSQSAGFSCWIFKDDIENNEFELYFYNGSYYEIVDLDTTGDGDDSWFYYSIAIPSDYFVSNFRVQFKTTDLAAQENVFVDDVAVNMTTSSLTDYQMRIITHFGSGSDSGENVYLDSYAQSDFDDVRFTNNSGDPLDYWRQEYNESSAIFWVEVDYIPPSPNNTTIYIYYGNGDVTTTSNFDDTFIFGDPFDDSTLDTARWTSVDGNPVYSIDDTNHYLEVTDMDNEWYTGKGFHSKNFIYPESYIVEDAYGKEEGYIGWQDSAVNGEAFSGTYVVAHTDWNTSDRGVAYSLMGDHWAGDQDTLVYLGVGGDIDYDSGRRPVGLPISYRFLITKLSGNISITEDGVERVNETNSEVPDRFHLGLAGSTSFGTIRFYAFKIRKFVDPEPTHGDWGEIEITEGVMVYFYFNSGGKFLVDNVTIANGTNIFYANETIIELVALVDGNNTATFSNFTWSLGSNTSNPSLLLLINNTDVWCYFGTELISTVDPVARFNTTITTAFTNHVIYFDGSMSLDPDGGSIADYSWNFGDGNTTSGNYPTITHFWSAVNSYTMNLTVTDDEAATNSFMHTINITNTTPFARFNTTITTAYLNETIFFDASMSNSTDNSITDYSWDFDDGNTTSGNYPNITHAWDRNLILNESWIELGDWEKYGSGTSIIDPAGQLKQIGVVGRRLDIVGLLPTEYTVEFTLIIDDYGIMGQGYEYQFHNDDELIWIRISEQWIHNQGNPVMDRIYCENDEDTWYTWTFVIDTSLPRIDIYRDGDLKGNFTIFTGSVEDGRVETEALLDIEGHEDYMRIYTPIHTPQNFTLNLTVTDSHNREDSFSQIITITEHVYGYPTARFIFTPSDPDVDEPITFNGTLSTDIDGSISSYFWTFGDGTNSSDSIATKNYTSVGNYTVTLNVTDNDGFWNTTSQIVSVFGSMPAWIIEFDTLPLYEIIIFLVVSIFFSILFVAQRAYAWGYIAFVCWMIEGILWLLIQPLSYPVALIFMGIGLILLILSVILQLEAAKLGKKSLGEEMITPV